MCVCTLVLPPPLQKLRALKCLRRVLNGLSTKRFVMEPPKPGSRTAFIGACFRARMVVCVCVCVILRVLEKRRLPCHLHMPALAPPLYRVQKEAEHPAMHMSVCEPPS